MKKTWTREMALVLLLAATPWAFGLERLPSPPTAETTPPAPLPRLTEPFTPDGVLKEWTTAACVPVRSQGCIAHIRPSHQWRGPADAGLEWYGAWNEDGLCLAAVVADEEVRNDRTEDTLWQQDCVELFLDGRQGDRFLKSPYSPGVCQLLIRPPLPGQAAVAVPARPNQKAEKLQLGARRTASGYAVELLVPWANFPEISPQAGTQVGLQCGLDDWDPRDGQELQPLMMTMEGMAGLAQDPSRFIRWALVEQIAAGEQTYLGPQLLLDAPLIAAAERPLRLGLTAGGWLAARTSSLEVRLQAASGAPLWPTRLRPKRLAAPWTRSWRAEADLPTKRLPVGGYSLTVVARDGAGRAIGQTRRTLYGLGDSLAQIYRALRRVDVAALAQKDAFKAAAYCGVGAAVERFKRAVERGNLKETVQTQHEVAARLELLEKGSLTVDPAEDWLELLRLGANPSAQVVVEYAGGYGRAGITFCWGSLPLVAVQVSRYDSPQAAAQALESPMTRPGLAYTPEKATLAGCPEVVTTTIFYELPLDPADYVPEKQALLLQGRSRLWVVDLATLDELQPAAVTVLASCPEAVRQQVSAWAAGRNLTLTDLATALNSETALVAGDPRTPETAPHFAVFKQWNRLQRHGLLSLSVLSGNRVLQVYHPSRKVGEEALALVLAGQAVTPAQVDGLRRSLVAELGTPLLAKEGSGEVLNKPSAEPSNLFCGDVHMHTFYSDGATSPVALLLEAIYAHLDYAVITDHNTIDGARLATRLMGQHGCSFPLTVGEEITMPYAHMNAYPLRRAVAWNLPAHETVKAAHAQGAVIQWNHPGFPGSPWDTAQQPKGLVGTALDAWEHYTPLYAEWKGQGSWPVFVGSTDTHDGTFSWPERTVIRGPSAHGRDLAEAVRARNAAMWSMEGNQLLYGREEVVEAIWAALAEGQRLKEDKAARLRAALQKVRLADLLKASPPSVVRD